MPTEKHPFEPFLPPGARILFLGSFPPQPHRWCMPFYYPNWINDFWRIMGLIHFCDRDRFCIQAEKRFDEAAIRSFCTCEGLAFYDTACEVRRLKDNASDAFLEVVTPTDVRVLLRQIPLCDTLVTTGQKATEVIAATFGCEIPPVGGCIDLKIDLQQSLEGSGGRKIDGRDGLVACGERKIDVLDGLASGGERTSADGSVSSSDGTINSGTGRTSSVRTVRFWRMPSTSRAYPLPLEKKADAYRRLFR